ncbi:restriction endonuclease subunit S [Kangiella taiwanensis]|uniref:Restriction endonuclease subunit S n=1 Tax=Kangiella taiwanensis TaxID=1079179 RepID=A0ABP8I532_9GAMM|nr:restriction endonuclease subunit S [Kangiella taiwanensis]
MIPEGWERTKLGSFVNIASGIAPSSLRLKQVGKYPYVKVEDMNNCSKYQIDSRTFTDDELKVIRKGAVIFPKRGAAIMNNKVRIAAKDIYLDSNMMSLYPKDGLITEYLYYCLIREELHRIADTSTIPQINNKHITPYIFLLPPLPEQKKIAEILSTWDKAITTTEKLLKNSQQQKKALMQQLLTGKKRLLDDNGVRFSGEWRKYKVSNMGETSSGGTPATSKIEFWDGEISWLTPTDVTALETKYVYETKRKITELGVKFSSAKLLPKGSLLICTRATIGAMAISKNEITTNQGFKNLIPNEMFIVEFLYYLFTFKVNEFKRKASGSTFLELSMKDFDKTEFFCPEIREQVAIGKALSATDKELEFLNNKIKHLKQEKKALMQQLLTGKRRVKID